mmetsp:Transcript_18788/g.46068  ORF Transcript_18788/g.46068 Transcript_18788/m.46068 type:complete len:267 (+) Transcript_18788:399-1199(+)
MSLTNNKTTHNTNNLTNRYKLSIKNLSVKLSSNNQKILRNLSLEINPGEIHILMGRNGSGKSTLSKAIVGHPSYTVSSGTISFKGVEITQLEPHIRSLNGIFLCFQNPVEIQGVKNLDFLRKISNSKKKYRGEKNYDPLDFYKFINEKLSEVGLDYSFLTRNVNEGFSGGEKKRNEMLQLITLNAEFCIFDEIDSGLDIDSIKNLAKLIKKLKKNNTGMIIITHYNKLIDLVEPDFVHILSDGEIKKTGDSKLAKLIEIEGFDTIN